MDFPGLSISIYAFPISWVVSELWGLKRPPAASGWRWGPAAAGLRNKGKCHFRMLYSLLMVSESRLQRLADEWINIVIVLCSSVITIWISTISYHLNSFRLRVFSLKVCRNWCLYSVHMLGKPVRVSFGIHFGITNWEFGKLHWSVAKQNCGMSSAELPGGPRTFEKKKILCLSSFFMGDETRLWFFQFSVACPLSLRALP